jgi:hypothetical protein
VWNRPRKSIKIKTPAVSLVSKLYLM